MRRRYRSAIRVGLAFFRRRLRQVDEQFRALQTTSLLALEEERKALSRDLHDTVAQDLVALKSLLSTVALRPEDRAKVTTLLDATLSEVRGIAVGLRPPPLKHVGFAGALRALCQQLSARTGMAIRHDIPESVHETLEALEDSAAVHLYRIVQESLHNAIHHSGGRLILVMLRREPDRLWLEVCDDGLGTSSLRPGSTRPGLGLLGMQERARLIGAAIAVESFPGVGLRVRVEVPL